MEEKMLVFNKFGFNVIKILNPINGEVEYYIYESFVPVDTIGGAVITHKHTIIGRNITQFLHEKSAALHMRTSEMDENILRNHIATLPRVTREYSSHYLWVNYINNR